MGKSLASSWSASSFTPTWCEPSQAHGVQPWSCCCFYQCLQQHSAQVCLPAGCPSACAKAEKEKCLAFNAEVRDLFFFSCKCIACWKGSSVPKAAVGLTSLCCTCRLCAGSSGAAGLCSGLAGPASRAAGRASQSGANAWAAICLHLPSKSS